MGPKIKRSFRNTCHDHNSTSTLNQHPKSSKKEESLSFAPSQVLPRKSVTLEEMIVQLELEEDKARREKAAKLGVMMKILICLVGCRV